MAHIEASSHPRIYAHLTINALNWKEIPEFVDLLSARVKGITVQFHYPYPGIDEGLLLPPAQRRAVLDGLIRMKRQGLPVVDSYACLRALKHNRWKCRPWAIASVEPDGKLIHGCYVKGRAEISCERCGFSAHTELSMALGGVFEPIWAGSKIFLHSSSAQGRV